MSPVRTQPRLSIAAAVASGRRKYPFITLWPRISISPGSPAAAAIDSRGWFRTGDIGTADADGYLYVVDRKKDLIIRGGFNVYPRELEEVLLTHPAVSLAAVVGVPHDSHGEEVKAYVVRTAGAELTEAELIAWCKQNMAAYKYPRIVEFRDSLPMTATGKILKRELVAPASAAGARP